VLAGFTRFQGHSGTSVVERIPTSCNAQRDIREVPAAVNYEFHLLGQQVVALGKEWGSLFVTAFGLAVYHLFAME
jgi:hypothetical protein